MRLWFSPRSKRWAGWLAAGYAFVRFVDWVVGKIGYLGIFTSPEDFRTMMERGPVWLQTISDAIYPVVLSAVGSLDAAWRFVVSPVGTVLVFATIALALTVDMDRLTRLTRRLWFNVRHAVSEQVWIGEDAAISLLRESQWGRLVAPFTEENMFNALTMAVRRTTGLSPADKDRIKFYIYLQFTLKEFASANPGAYRVSNDPPESQYDEVTLRAFLDVAVDDMIRKDFGEPPSFKVT